MKDEALKLALETFEGLNHEDSIFAGEFKKEITAIKQALAAQQPDVDAMIALARADERERIKEENQRCYAVRGNT
jgi:hypothetical protein